jgi:methylamine dehydrogenase accessory protein MauD
MLAAVFALAGIAKLVDRAGSVGSMRDFGVPPALVRPFAIILPLAELTSAIALIPARFAWWGAMGVLTLLIAFTVGIATNLARGRAPDCHCFGQLHSEPVGWKTVVRNAGFAGVAAFILWNGAGRPDASMVEWVLTASFPAIVAGLGMGIAAFALYLVFHVLRQNGRLLVRLEAVEAKLGIGARAIQPGLPVDTAAPAFTLRDLEGGTVTLDTLRNGNTPLLLVFAEPGCDACDALLPEVAQWQRDFADRLSTIVISRGTVGQNRNRRAKHDLKTVLLQVNREIADAYRVAGTPSAVLVSHGKIARPTATGGDAIRSLVRDATALRVRKRDSLPSLMLADLRGEPVDVSTLRGRRRLLLFWNPACGFCQRMLNEVKRWERHLPKGAPEIIVISSGSSEANTEQGFRSRVLLDDDFTAGQALGATGTPSAVLLDEHGRVFSDIAVGQEAVMALARTRADGCV